MDDLKVGPTWAKQIENIRNAHSDPTNIPRSKSDNYRTCRNSNASFTIKLAPSTAGHAAPLELQVRERDFYISKLGTHGMGRYSSGLKTDEHSRQKFLVGEERLNSAIHDLRKGTNPEKEFENVTLLTFCVAESLRFDKLALEIGTTIEAAYKPMSLQHWLPLKNDWEGTSRDIRARAPLRADRRTCAAAISVLWL